MQRKLTIFQINDTHAYLEPHPELVWSEDGPSYPIMGGYARIAALLKQARKEKPTGFLRSITAILSMGLILDAMTAHWEFAWGPKHFMKMTGSLDYPMLAINCYDKQTIDALSRHRL